VPGVSVCARGGEVMFETDLSKVHLDHRDDRNGYLGLSCAYHNLLAGAAAAARPAGLRRGVKAPPSPGPRW
jgi:hypothetical protein